ncbi:MAG: ATPase, T2SS/T4P/T4SS family [Gammaproteobacteria bacterium]|nr:ATPase, T2SS/T4P/T4SS family [Gammaproteobacteria bacterium]
MSTGVDRLSPFLPGLEDVLADMAVSELMINGPHNVWVERTGEGLRPADAPNLDKDTLHRAAIHIARPLGLDPTVSPTIDARLEDGSRVAICVPPASPHVAITIRRFGKRAFTAEDLVAAGSLPRSLFEAARQTLAARRNILVSGGTGTGKTTVVNALIGLLPPDERIVSIEDTLELRIEQPNTVRFEAREADTQDTHTRPVTVRSLVKHSLRHRPDHIVVGEIRGAEAADLLQALNTGHGGSLTTIHANTAVSALSRLASCAMAARDALPWEVVCRSVVDGIALVLHTARARGRRVVENGIYVRGWQVEDNSWLTEDAATGAPSEH